jgi:flagellar biosynthesis regulator FlbT
MNGGFNNGFTQGNGFVGGSGSTGSSMTEMIKTYLMTTLMVKNIHGTSNNGGGGGGSWSDSMSMMYMFIFSQLAEQFIRYFPYISAYVTNTIYLRYIEKHIETMDQSISDTKVKDISDDNKIKVKTSSIKININITDHENLIGQALLDYITNHRNTKYVSYINQNFILNQKDVIQIEEDVFAIMKDQIENSTPSMETIQNFHNTRGASGANGLSHSSANQQSQSQSNNSGNIEQVIEVYSFTKTVDELRDFLNKITHYYSIKIKNKLEGKTYYFNMFPVNAIVMQDGTKDYTKIPNNFVFTMKHFQTNRHFDNLFGEEIDKIRSRVKFFTKNRKWYDKKGIPYTLGLLLSGKPGAGKTSTIKCLANETKRHIFNINLNNDITKTQLENLFFNEMVMVMNPSTMQNEKYFIPLDERVYVLEDIDCQSDIILDREKVEKEKKEFENLNALNPKYQEEKRKLTTKQLTSQQLSSNKLDLSFLLNLLDGVLETPGRIIIMTSNYPELIDKALVRPGRVDVIANFDNAKNSIIIQMMEFFYETKLTEEDKQKINMLDEFVFSPAEVSKFMFENILSYKDAISALHIEAYNKKLAKIQQIEEEAKEEKENDNCSENIYDTYADKKIKRDDSETFLYNDIIKNNYEDQYNNMLSDGLQFTFLSDLDSKSFLTNLVTDKKEDRMLFSKSNKKTRSEVVNLNGSLDYYVC